MLLQLNGPLRLRKEGLNGYFLLGSLVLHLLFVLVIILQIPALRQPAAPSLPMTVTILDADAIHELALGPETRLPEKPQNLEPRPRGRLTPFPSPPSVTSRQGRDSAQSGPVNEGGAVSRSTDAGTPMIEEKGSMEDMSPILREMARDEFSEPSEHAVAGRERKDARDPAAGGTPLPGLPFVNREELNRFAKLYTEESRASKEPYMVNTQDLQYLSYIAHIARTLELIWKYPREAGQRGQEGKTVLRITILDDGTLQDTQLIQTSGHPLLDDEAVRVVTRIAPYQQLPKSWRRTQWDLTISFTYHLRYVVVGVI